MNTTVGEKAGACDRPRTAVGFRTLFLVGLLGLLMSTQSLVAAELSVGDLKIRPHGQGQVVVSGKIDGELTYGVTIMVELVPHPGSRGTVEFTPAVAEVPTQRPSFSVQRSAGKADAVRVAKPQRADVDIVQLGDPWPDQGSFTPFDTDVTESPTLNGTVEDNGTFIGAPVTFSGVLSTFPVHTSANARGVWDVKLSTSRGNSSWEAVSTTTTAGVLTVTPKACMDHSECQDRDACTIDTCDAGTCTHVRQEGPCDGEPRKKRARSQRVPTRGSE